MSSVAASPALPIGSSRTLTHALGAALLDVRAVLAVATALILATAWWCRAQSTNLILAYADAPTHLNLARRVHDDIHPGLGQLGDYWLPLAHVLELPFVWNDTLWRTGLAGTIPSMGCYLLSVWCIYQLALLATDGRMPAVIASLAFAANPNVLYLHVVPMFEPAIIASMLAATYLLARWLHGGGYGTLVVAAAAMCVATTSRYETWGLAAASAVVVTIALWQRGDRGSRLRGHLLLYLLLAWYGMALWLVWNLSLSGDPFYFLHPGFNKGLGEARLAVLTKHHPLQATAYVVLSIIDNAGPLPAALAAFGLWRFAVAFGIRARGLWLYLLAAPAAFDAFYLWFKGTPPILVPQLIPHTSGNIRYGVISLPLLCLLAGYLARRPVVQTRPGALIPMLWLLVQIGLLAAVLAQPLLLLWRHDVVSFNEATTRPYVADQSVRTTLAHWLGSHYHGGRILMSTFKGADRIILDSGLPDRDFVHEGSQNTWRCALARPQAHVRWVVLFKGGDGAAILRNTRSVAGGEYFTRITVPRGGAYYWVFKRNGRPWRPLHPGPCG
jgi:hypothetical protein